jgi:hypothetical protein
MKRPFRFCFDCEVGALLALAALLTGCVANRAQPNLALTPPALPSKTPAPMAPEEISPAPPPETSVAAQQLTGQVVAGVQAELSSRIATAIRTALRAEVEATGVGGDVSGYRSEFGIGATLVVTLSLVLVLVLTHRREMQRIKQNGKHTA